MMTETNMFEKTALMKHEYARLGKDAKLLVMQEPFLDGRWFTYSFENRTCFGPGATGVAASGTVRLLRRMLREHPAFEFFLRRNGVEVPPDMSGNFPAAFSFEIWDDDLVVSLALADGPERGRQFSVPMPETIDGIRELGFV
jgi:hypothetical protein